MLALVLAGHLLIGAAATTLSPMPATVEPAPAEAAPMILFARSMEAPRAPPSVAPRPHVAAARSNPAAAAVPGPAAPPCGLIAAIEQSLSENPLALQSLTALPPGLPDGHRALLLWADGWHPLTAEEAPLAPLRAAVVAAVRALPPACRAQPLTGPRLAIVRAEQQQWVLAFGAGRWSWAAAVDDSGFFGPPRNRDEAAAYPEAEGPLPAGPASGTSTGRQEEGINSWFATQR